MSNRYVERLVDLTDRAANRITHGTIEEARERVGSGDPEAVKAIRGSFALVARSGSTVRMARSLDRPLRYFLAKRIDGPALVVADRIDTIHRFLKSEGLDAQFHPTYTRMVPAHHVVEIQLVGCPDPAPTYARFLAPRRVAGSGSSDVREIGRRYIGALADEIAEWLATLPEKDPVGVCFSGGIDSGAVFLTTYHVMRRLGMHPGRLKAFTLSAGGDGADLVQARRFLSALSLELFLEPVEVSPDRFDAMEAVRVVEDYKPLDVESAAVALALCRGIRQRYPEWRYLMDGDGGDENLKDYPIEANSEVTIRSVIQNPLLYQEGWGVGRLKHSLTYSGGQSRSCTRTYAPARVHGFEGFSPFTRPALVAMAAGLPFAELTEYDLERLYALKGAIVSQGVEAVTGLAMPVFPKRRFQHGALAPARGLGHFSLGEADYRRQFLALYA